MLEDEREENQNRLCDMYGLGRLQLVAAISHEQIAFGNKEATAKAIEQEKARHADKHLVGRLGSWGFEVFVVV